MSDDRADPSCFRLDHLDPDQLTVLVGRAEELRTLIETVGCPSVVLLEGEAGIGRSRARRGDHVDDAGGTSERDGTSMTTPHVTAAALLLEQTPNTAPADIISELERTAASNVIDGAPQRTIADLLQAPGR